MPVVYLRDRQAKLDELESLRRRHKEEEQKLVRELNAGAADQDLEPLDLEKRGRDFTVRGRAPAVKGRGCAVRSRVTGGGRISAIDRPARVGGRWQPDVTTPSTSGLVPHGYQADGILWTAFRRRALLADDMGVGKSMQALRALPPHPRAIIVTQASVISSWIAQIREWAPHLTPVVCDKSTLGCPPTGHAFVISYDSLPDLRAHTTALIDQPLADVHLILDECQQVMNDDALRSKKVRRLRAQCGWCWGLSATPMVNNPENLWGVLMSLGLTHVFENNKKVFVEMCGGRDKFVWDKRANFGRGKLRRIGYEWGTVSPEVRERLKEIMLRRLADDVLDDLPEVEEYDIPVAAPESLVPFLDKVKKEWDDVEPNDLPPFELLSEAMAALARSKIPAALEIANEKANQSPLLVFSAHVDPILAMRKLKGAGAFVGTESLKERNRLIDKFQRGKLRILAMSIGVGGVGLNLQHAGGVLFIDRSYVPGANKQAFARARRQGNKRARVVNWRMVSDHPLDQHLSQILDRKSALISATVG